MAKAPVTMKHFALIAIVGFALSSMASAAVLVQYPFTTAAPADVAEGMSAGNATWVGVSGGQVGFGGTLGTAYAQSNLIPNALDEGVYLSFNLKANDGFSLNLDSFSFQLGGTTGATTTLTVFAEVRTSLDNYASSLVLTPGSATAGSAVVPAGTSIPSFTTFTASLGNSFDELNDVTFRLYVYNARVGSATSTYLRLDSVSMDGSLSPIPEPGTVILLVTGLLLVTWLRRSGRKA